MVRAAGDRLRARIAAQLHSLGGEGAGDARQERRGDGGVDEELFGGVADPRA